MTTRNEHDPRVTETYRDLATEKTPAELDDEVLAMAAREARTRYGLTRAWIRPVAWAATIALSLAFILEMTRYQEVDTHDAAPELSKESAPRADAELSKEGAPQADAAPAAPMEAKREASLRTRDAVHTAAFAVAEEKEEQSRHCDDNDRATPEAWYECIEALREEGRVDDATTELETLRETFPEFRQAFAE